MRKFFLAIFIIIVIASAATSVGYLLYKKYPNSFNFKDYDASCVVKEKDIVQGESLSGLVENGQEITLLKNYYNCNPINRGDVVAYNYSKNPNPIIKIVKALPGDSFEFRKKENSSSYYIIINNEIAENSNGDFYELTEARTKMLSLYIKDYNGIIPENTLIILGNQPGGSMDSTKFGLASQKNIIGKVEIK
jgi:signal peptidase I